MNTPPPFEYTWFCAGAVLVGLAALLAWRRSLVAVGGPAGLAARLAPRPALLVDLALAALATGIALRWLRLGHGPFLNMFEILASSLVSLGLAWRIAHWRLPAVRESAPVALGLLAVMAAWLLTVDPVDTHRPATYEMGIMWFHILLGKIFLGCALVATALAGVILARAGAWGRTRFQRMPADATLDALAWRLMLAALVFESLMLVAGAVWAQDAWGRFWAWDPLETWAFVTWLALSAAVHARLAWRLGPRAGALMIVAVFVLAFLTFFGVPFVTLAPHKGAV
ncbi:MAG TPA: cytochrome c biogenesis protein CcsA [Ramlibacter sp.]|uniref:cytochrome c biogenesis protein n=1 Tax=Ramlibacter sp. TaxID=1917967 RepID=UPI002D7EFA64|nr:cytochrome c biogenesis protein CcsA [Ramlibacter sp.]HET8745409.1 cytochrome c biogenesis protein CcsA [Ramlibacter sp.]